MRLAGLREAIKESKTAALLLGAGISVSLKIPAGYEIPIRFANTHPGITKEHNLKILLQKANTVKDYASEGAFIRGFVKSFKESQHFQRAFLDWLHASEQFPAMAGVKSDTHSAFVISWLKGIFSHLVTTNWDFLLEYQIDALYHSNSEIDGKPLDPFDAVPYSFKSGKKATVESEELYFLNLQKTFLERRWNLMSHRPDLKNLFH